MSTQTQITITRNDWREADRAYCLDCGVDGPVDEFPRRRRASRTCHGCGGRRLLPYLEIR